jgi:hypothetical protein
MSLSDSLVSIATAIVGVAIIATLVSNRAQTSAVIASAGKAFSETLGVAVGPVTGYVPSGGGLLGGVNVNPTIGGTFVN